MDFAAYVEARRTSLVRAAVLLGHPPSRAAAAVDTLLVARGRAIGRSDHPDPEVHAALARELGPPPAHPEPAPDGDGADVRDALLHLDPTSRAVGVLVLHADLTDREVAAALGLKPAEVAEPLARAVAALGVAEEIDAREQVALAADTIAVPPLTAPLEPAPADRRPWLAAAAVLLVVGLTTAVLARDGDDTDGRDPDPAPGGARIPSLFAYDITSARELLESQGLVVSEERVQVCEPADHVVGTKPPTGSRLPAGSTVTIFTAFPENSCLPRYFDREDAWAFIDFATGRGPAPPFTGRIDVVVDDRAPLTLTNGEAAVRSTWGDPSVLSDVANVTEQVAETTDSTYVTPVLSVEPQVPPRTTCGVDRPSAVGRREALRITIGLPAAPVLCPLVLDLYRTEGAIDTVVLYTQKSPR